MALYKLPIGIRIPNDDEYPKGNDVRAITDRRNSANIVEGFFIKEVTGNKFSHYAECNMDCDKIWDVFVDLSNNLIKDIAYGVIGYKETEPQLSKFTARKRIIDIFYNYKFELVNDGFSEFGIVSHDDNSFNEIYIPSFKYMKIWTNQKESLVRTLKSHGINEVDNLQFIDQFPVISQSLTCFVKGVKYYSGIKDLIVKEFDKLK